MDVVKVGLGVGAVVSALSTRVHPRKAVRAKLGNEYGPQTRLQGLEVVRRGSHRGKDGVFCSLASFTGEELFVIPHNLKVQVDAQTREWFLRGGGTQGEVSATSNQPDDPSLLLPDGPSVADSDRIDDDNEPLPDNVPRSDDDAVGIAWATDWGHSGVCPREAEGIHKRKAKIVGLDINKASPGKLFEHMFPMSFVEGVIIPATNAADPGLNLTQAEFMLWLGLWLFIGTFGGAADRRQFWSTSPPDPFGTVPVRVSDYGMSCRRFERILSSLRIWTTAPPYEDRFFRIREFQRAWNEHTAKVFTPGWTTTIDESMNKWTSILTGPGVMFVPRKPTPLGNEYRAAACAATSVVYQVELVEGSDRPVFAPPPEFDYLGKTVGLVLRMTKPIWNTGDVVMMDSGFGVLDAIIQLKKRGEKIFDSGNPTPLSRSAQTPVLRCAGLFAVTQVKKRRYWPKHIPGDVIVAKAAEEGLGACVARKGERLGETFHLFAQRDTDYTTMVMATCGTSTPTGPTKERIHSGQSVTFQYPRVLTSYYAARHAVDDNNNLRQGSLSLEDVWKTHQWWVRQLTFFVALTESNCVAILNKMTAGAAGKCTLVAFRKAVAKHLVTTYSGETEQHQQQRRKRPHRGIHVHAKRPHHCGKWEWGRWKVQKKKYYTMRCRGVLGLLCGKDTRGFCSCDPHKQPMCETCFGRHSSMS